MPSLREAAIQALEAMESVEWYGAGSGWMVDADAIEEAITALRAALAEPPDSTKLVAESEPVAWLTPKTVDSYMRPDLGYETCSKTDYAAFPVYTAPPQRKPEPVQEPVAWLAPRNVDSYSRPDLGYETCSKTDYGAFPVYTAPSRLPAKPVQKPVAWRTFDGEGGYDYRTYEDNEDYAAEWAKRNPRHAGWVEPLYTAPPQRKPLTDEEIHDCWQQKHRDKVTERRLITRAIERAHGIGGNNASA